MIKILFVCHGNICRSPMGEFVLKDMVAKAGREDDFEIASRAVSREEIGNPVYGPARKELKKHTGFFLTSPYFGKQEKVTNLLVNLGLYRTLRPIFHRE